MAVWVTRVPWAATRFPRDGRWRGASAPAARRSRFPESGLRRSTTEGRSGNRSARPGRWGEESARSISSNHPRATIPAHPICRRAAQCLRAPPRDTAPDPGGGSRALHGRAIDAMQPSIIGRRDDHLRTGHDHAGIGPFLGLQDGADLGVVVGRPAHPWQGDRAAIVDPVGIGIGLHPQPVAIGQVESGNRAVAEGGDQRGTFNGHGHPANRRSGE